MTQDVVQRIAIKVDQNGDGRMSFEERYSGTGQTCRAFLVGRVPRREVHGSDGRQERTEVKVPSLEFKESWSRRSRDRSIGARTTEEGEGT